MSTTISNTAIPNAATPGDATPDAARHVSPSTERYLPPDRVSRSLLNPFVTGLVRLGWSVRGAQQLQVRRRASGGWQTVPVNPLPLDGRRYLVAPRGHTQWVRNLRAAGTGRLRRGRRVEDISAVEVVVDAAKVPVLREYLRRWSAETARFFDDLTVDSTDAELTAAATGFPVFEIAAPATRTPRP